MSFLKLYARVLGLLGPEKWLAAGLALANVALAVSLFAEPMLFGKVIDQLSHSLSAGASLQWSGIGPWLAAWAAFGVFSIVAGVTVALHADRLAHRRRVVVMAGFFDHVLHLPMSFHASAHTGRLLKVMIEGASGMFGVWLSFFREHFAALVALVVLLPATLIVNWRLGSILLALVVILGFLMNIVLRKTETMQTAADVYSNDLAERVSDVLGNMPAIQSFARADEETGAISRMIDRMLNAQMPVLTWWALASVATRSSSTLALVSILITGVWLLMQGLTTIGQIVAFMSLAQMLVGRLEQTVGFANYMLSQSPKLRMFFDVIDAKPDVTDAPDAVAAGRLTGHVLFEDVSFSYDKSREALQDVTFDAPPGETIALVGATGSGKTTALNLLHRVFDPTDGRVLIDGRDIRTITLESLRANIGVVFQEPFIFARSIAENLRIGKPNATKAEMEQALEAAQAIDFVRRAADGLQTVIGERGRNLSGGERQRLSIARALLKNPPIMILDEATSSLDAKTERQVQQALEAAMRGRTTFVIAHRLATIRNADRILVFDQGRVIESGAFDELVAKGGVFAALAKAQFMTGAEPAPA
ncbi:MAG TPA: glucan ABC transporter ATP-binding protein/ permease [Roseiarcus sp.]|nr:glucan ABC transporter ATP-binding protein/ permease [Roseiarcus sp.]